MSYTKQTWVTGDIITADKLNHMEDGIAGAESGADVRICTVTVDNQVNADANANANPNMLRINPVEVNVYTDDLFSGQHLLRNGILDDKSELVPDGISTYYGIYEHWYEDEESEPMTGTLYATRGIGYLISISDCVNCSYDAEDEILSITDPSVDCSYKVTITKE